MTYAKWFEACQLVKQFRESCGDLYCDGVVRAAALAAMEQIDHGCSTHAAIERVDEVFRQYVWGRYVMPLNVKASIH